MQIPCVLHGTNHVISALNDHARDMTDFGDIAKQLIFVAEERFIDEIVGFDTRERESLF